MNNISICMCTYNGEKYIFDQLDSIVNQTLIPDQIVICDDNSSDNTIQIINEFSVKYTSIEWCIIKNEKNIGWKENFNQALHQCKGNIIFLADQDDIWLKNKINDMYKIINEKKEIILLSSNYILKDEKNNKLLGKYKETNCLEKIDNINFLNDISRPGCTYCLKKELLIEFNKYFNKNTAHDALLWRLAYLNDGLYNINKNLIIWRRHGDNATASTFKKLSFEKYKENLFCYTYLYDLFYRLLDLKAIITNERYKKLLYMLKYYELKRGLYENFKFSIVVDILKKRKACFFHKNLLDICLAFKYRKKRSN